MKHPRKGRPTSPSSALWQRGDRSWRGVRCGLVALGEGERIVHATGPDIEAAARAVLAL